jgi:7-carboxy-7-deazaguanine synthase
MPYRVKEIFYSICGEGANTGRPAVFVRFSGCNLWSGREEDRSKAICRFCDTDFVGVDGPGGGVFETAIDLAEAVESFWPLPTLARYRAFVVLTGGEPALQVDGMVIAALKSRNFEVAIETNGTRPFPPLDWVCVSPKAGAELVVRSGDELKLVFPQQGAEPGRYEGLNFRHFYLQPMAGPLGESHTKSAVDYCLTHPRWRLSLQVHKSLGLR